MAVLRSNVPLHFPASDEAGFRAFLADLPGPYFVVAAGDGAVVACGGIALEEYPAVATLCWGIVRADAQLKGVGSALLRHRLEAFLPHHPGVRRIQVNTTQKVQGLFERHRFTAVSVVPDGYGPGLDWVRMERGVN